MDNYNPDHEYSGSFLLEIGYFMVATTGMMLANEFLLKPAVIKEVNMRVVLIWSAWLSFSMGLGNYLLYNWLGNWHDLSWGSAVLFILNCSTVFVFPLVGIFFLYRYRSLRNRMEEINLQTAEKGADLQLIEFRGEGRADQYALAPGDFRYAQAQDNYVALYYVVDGNLHKYLIRSSLSELLLRTAWDDLVRCHRSYAVNLLIVRSVQMGNPMLLYLKDVMEPIRVSRSYKKEVIDSIKKGSPEA